MTEAYIGEIRLFTGGFAPRGWLVCDGRQVPAAAYPDLFGVIGTRYGAGDGTFAVPDLKEAARAAAGAAYIIASEGRKPERDPETIVLLEAP